MKSDGITVSVSDENERRLISALTDGVNATVVFTDNADCISSGWVVIVGAECDIVDTASRRATLARPISLSFVGLVIDKIKSEPKTDTAKPVLVMSDGTREVSYGDKTARLSPKEYDVFKLIGNADGKIVAREEIESAVWQNCGKTNVADVTVAYLRRKLRRAFGMEMIITVRGKGYIYALGRNDNGDI